MLGLFNKEKKNTTVDQQDPMTRAEKLLKEYSRIFKCFRNHPYISVKEVFGTPPEKYHFFYRVDGLVHTGKSLESKNDHLIEISLPAGYPVKEPVCKALTPIYHPNISPEIIDIKQLLTPGIFLADLAVRIGEMIVFQRYSIDEPLNLEASQWAARNKSILPLSSVNLNYALPEDAPDTVLLGNQPAEAAEAADQSPAGNAQQTESIIIESDSDKIKFDQEKPAASRESPKGQHLVEMLFAEEEKREDAIITEEDTVAIPDSPATGVHNPDEKAAVTKSQTTVEQTKDIGFEPDPSSRPDIKTEYISRHDLYCPSCGNKNSRKANFCIYCGTRIAGKSGLKNARTFFVASMIAVPVIIIGSGIGAIFLRTANLGFLKIPLSQTSPSGPNLQKAEQEKSLPVPNKDSDAKNTAQKEAPQETKTAPPKAEKALLPDKPSSIVTYTPSASKQSPIMETPSAKPVKNKKRKVETALEPPVRSQKNIVKSDAENAAPHPSAPHAVNEHQKPEKIANTLKLAKLYVGIGSYDDAIAQYLDVLMLDPANQEAREGLVKARETKKTTLDK